MSRVYLRSFDRFPVELPTRTIRQGIKASSFPFPQPSSLSRYPYRDDAAPQRVEVQASATEAVEQPLRLHDRAIGANEEEERLRSTGHCADGSERISF